MGVALAMGIQGEAKWALLATVLVVVVLTVILFGGTTASMLEILGIKVGCVDEHDSDDEFDIEAPRLPISTPPTNHASGAFGNRRFGNFSNFNGYVDEARDTNSGVNMGSFKPQYPPQSTNSSSADLLQDDEALNPDDNIIPDPAPMVSEAAANNGGVLGAFLSAEEHARWFTRLDEEILKPVLLDNGLQKDKDK